MSDVANLEIRVDSKGVVSTERALDKLASTSTRTERATDRLGKTWAGTGGKLLGLASGVGAVAASMAALSKLVDVAREFDKLNAGLITSTGSAEEAKKAFAAIQDFATQTPYSLRTSVEAFTKLVNYGLVPSERAMRSFGDTSSALGKDLLQMVEAVADAQTGEFERLKEFGIKASAQGDKVKFVFRGVATTVQKDAASIQEYLVRLGEQNFAGAMEKRMATLDGALSNLGDSWDKLFLSVSQQGVGQIIQDTVRAATEALDELTAMVESGQLGAQIDAYGGQFAAFGKDAVESIRIIGEAWSNNSKGMVAEGEATIGLLASDFRTLPMAVRAAIQDATIEITSFLDGVISSVGYVGAVISDVFTGQDTAARKMAQDVERIGYTVGSLRGEYEAERATALNSYREKLAESARLRAAYDQEKSGVAAVAVAEKAALAEKKAALDAAAKAYADADATQADAAKRRLGEAKKEADAAQAAVDKAIKAQDRLAKYAVGGKSKPQNKEAEAAEKRRREEFKKLEDSLRDEEEKIADSYAKRNALIERYTKEGTEKRGDLMLASRQLYDEELKALREKDNAEVRSLEESLRTQEESIQASYVKRIQLIQANVDEMDPLYEQLTKKATDQRDRELKELTDAKEKERETLMSSVATEEEQTRIAYERQRKEILDSTALTETERASLLLRLREKHHRELYAMEVERATQIVSASEMLFGGLAETAKNFGGEQSKTYKTLFAISKAFSVAQGALSIATGLAKAQELGWPANLGAMIQVAATGAQIMAQISGANYSGAYDKGGKIPAGSVGIVGEYGPEFVQGPATVTSRKDTREMLARAAAPAAAPVQPIRIINTFDPATVKNYLSSSDGERVIMNQVQRNRNSNRRTA